MADLSRNDGSAHEPQAGSPTGASGGAPVEALAAALGDLDRTLVDSACGLMQSLGAPCRVAHGLLADQIYAWHWRNRLRVVLRAKALFEEQGTPVRVIPAGFLMPLLDAAGEVDDEDLRELWAQLVVSGVAEEALCHPGFVHVLRHMARSDAVCLAELACFERVELRDFLAYMASLDVAELDSKVALANLIRLGLALREQHEGSAGQIAHLLSVTAFGRHLLLACAPPQR